MKLISKYQGYCKAHLYRVDEQTYALKVDKKDMAKYTTSLHNFVRQNVENVRQTFTIRESSEITANGYVGIIEKLPTDFRYFNLVIIKTDEAKR